MLLKRVDSLIGPFAIALLPTPVVSRAPQLYSNLLIIRPGGIGDAVLLIPALNALKQKHPDARITVLAEKRNAAVFDLTDVVSEVLLYHKRADLVAALQGGYDVVLDTEQWHRLSALVARLVRAPVSIGFGTNERKRMFSNSVAYSHGDHETRSFFNLTEPLGVLTPQEVAVPFLRVPEQAASRREQLLAPLSGSPYVVVFPGATVAEKRWGVEKYRELVSRLNSLSIPVVAVGGREEVNDAERIVSHGANVNLAGRTSLAETAALIEKAQLLVTCDSGVMHLAYGLGTSTVSLFGPSNAQKWGPSGEKHLIVSRKLSCSPCSRFGYTPRCPSQIACMAELSVDEVCAAVECLLGAAR